MCRKVRGVPFVFFVFLHLTPHTFAQEVETFIRSDQAEFVSDVKIYFLRGNAQMNRDGVVITADEIEFHEETSLVKATGNVIYDDADVTIETSYAELNLDRKTGNIGKGHLLFKKDNYHLSGETIIKKAEKEYFIEKASFTTCDAAVPAWCFHADEAEIEVGNWLKAKGATFKLKGLPAFYSPIFIAPFQRERKSGFLLPAFGFRSDKGAYLNLPFYWVISDNRDATFYIDTYTKRGIGQGVEYRYVERGGIKGEWNLYHLRDNELKEDFFLVNGKHNQFTDDGFSTVIDVNYLNEKDFFREYSPHIETRVQRFLESTGDISLSKEKMRLYLLSQGWVDLRDETDKISQRIPEVGFTVHPMDFKGIKFSLASSVTNFWSGDGIQGQRADIFPRVYHETGKFVRLTQTAGVRGTFYSLTQNPGFQDNPHNGSLAYTASVDTTLRRKYGELTHLTEPTLSYNFISEDNNAPVFDSVETFDRASVAKLSFMNYLTDRKGFFLFLRLVNDYDFNKSKRPFGPLKLDTKLLRPLHLRANASYNYYEKEITEANSEISFKVYNIDFSVGERFSKENDIFFLTGSMGFHLLKNLRVNTNVSHDLKGGGLRQFGMNALYSKQCWALDVHFIQRPDDYSVFFIVELKGLGQYKLPFGI